MFFRKVFEAFFYLAILPFLTETVKTVSFIETISLISLLVKEMLQIEASDGGVL